MSPEKRTRLGGVIIGIAAAMLLLAAVLPICPWARRRHAGLVDVKETVEVATQAGISPATTSKTTTTEKASATPTAATKDTISESTISTAEHASATKTTTEKTPGAALNAPQAFATSGMLLLLIGVPLRVPQLLHDGKEFSAMRVVFYGIAGLFGVLAVRAGWDAQSIADIKIDPAWAALLSTAFAAKAAQSFAENRNVTS